MVDAMDIARYMTVVDGTVGEVGGQKEAVMGRHLDRLASSLAGFEAANTVLIGDSLDDLAAARAHGVKAVLYDGGSHHIGDLEQAGVPVAGSLMAAIEYGAKPH